ncbi:MAG: hypothetical protein AB1461_10575 [Thermodesulfobacteriota bacterium]
MKKMMLTVSLVSLLTMTVPAWAEEAHHPAGQPAPETAMEAGKMDAEIRQMQEMRVKIANEKNPATRKELMHQHMQMMQGGMRMMGMMGGKDMMQQGGQSGMMGGKGMMQGSQPAMMEKEDTAGMPMADRMTMMEKKMAMMENMMGGKGMMGRMEKKMAMMEEIMKGMMTQHQMMIE